MDHNEGALAPGHVEDLQHLAVVQLEVIIGHEDLERGIAVLDQRRQVLTQRLLVRVRHDQVEAVVYQAFALAVSTFRVGA
jgi:hypothetical protein